MEIRRGRGRGCEGVEEEKGRGSPMSRKSTDCHVELTGDRDFQQASSGRFRANKLGFRRGINYSTTFGILQLDDGPVWVLSRFKG